MRCIENDKSSNSLFVYGTLVKTDFFIKLFNERPWKIHEGWIFGKMYDCGNFPMITSDPERKVYGLIYTLVNLEELLPKIDRYERCNVEHPEVALYERKIVDAHFDSNKKIRAWTYFGNPSSDFFSKWCVKKNSISSGRWKVSNSIEV